MWLIPLAAAAPAVIPDPLRPVVQSVRAYTGDPYLTDGLRFTFVVGDRRRAHRWDVRNNRIEVRWTKEDGQVCTVVTTVGYAGDDATQREAWEIFVNDQFWLLAPSKIADDGATVSGDATALTVAYAGVGVTPGDRYTYTLDPSGAVTAWQFVLVSGRSGRFTWAPATQVGPLRLSLERTTEGRTIRFEDVAVGPIQLGDPSVACATQPR